MTLSEKNRYIVYYFTVIMLDTKLIQVLRCLDAKETKKLYEFLDSPFFVKREKGVILLKQLRGYFPTFESPSLTKEFLYKQMLHEDEFNNLEFNRILVYAMDIVEDFLRYYHFQVSDAHVNQPVFNFYQKHDLDKHFDALHKSLLLFHEKNKKKNADYLFQKWILASDIYSQAHHQYARGEMQPFNLLVESLDNFYIAKRLEYMCLNISLKDILNKKENNFIENLLVQYLNLVSIEKTPPVIQIYYYVYLMLKGENGEEYFDKINALNIQYGSMLNNIERLNLYISLQNFCIQQINKKDSNEYRKKLFSLYQESLLNELMFDINGNIAPSQFKNIVRLGLGLEEYEWVTYFIENYVGKLSADKQTDVANEAKALFAFATGQYQQTLKILQETEPIDIFFKIDAKRLLIRTYYELEEYELALSSLNTFRVFVHRDNLINENHKLTNRNFANLLTKLIQADKAAKVVKLLAEAKEMPSVADRKWLVEKIEMRVAEM